ncbi:MAG TPA: hypothetical protein VK644_01650 [Chitinophagaceae bacterium]|nr:hypothetical protein [Chitinophagaceae bacterium]
MKRIFLISSLLLVCFTGLFAQEDDDKDDNESIRDKMSEYIQKRLNLSNDESKKFAPVFINYFKDWRKALRENKNDDILRRQKVAEVQLRYRNQFKDIIGEQRSNQVFGHQKVFIQEIRRIRQERKNKG